LDPDHTQLLVLVVRILAGHTQSDSVHILAEFPMAAAPDEDLPSDHILVAHIPVECSAHNLAEFLMAVAAEVLQFGTEAVVQEFCRNLALLTVVHIVAVEVLQTAMVPRFCNNLALDTQPTIAVQGIVVHQCSLVVGAASAADIQKSEVVQFQLKEDRFWCTRPSGKPLEAD
jgi:hypothetical protein